MKAVRGSLLGWKVESIGFLPPSHLGTLRANILGFTTMKLKKVWFVGL